MIDLSMLKLYESDKKEFLKQIEELYNEELQRFKELNTKYNQYTKEIVKYENLAFLDKAICVNPEETMRKQFVTNIKNDWESLYYHQKYDDVFMSRNTVFKNMMHLSDELRELHYILEDFGINKNDSDYQMVFSKVA